MFDINPGELLILLVVAVVVIGPERLPKYAAELAKLVRYARGFARNAREQVREELGEDFDDIDWQALDPRRYDPRRIVREALLEDDDEPGVSDRAPNVPSAMRPDDDGPHGATAAGLNGTGGPLNGPEDDLDDTGGALNGPLNGPLNGDEEDDGGVPAPRPSRSYDADAT